MEHLKVLDYSDVFIGCYFTDNLRCAHANREHMLMYLVSGSLEIDDHGTKTTLSPGQCAFIRRDHRIMLSKTASPENPYKSIVLKFSRKFLRELYSRIDRSEIPADAVRTANSLTLLPKDRPDIISLFGSIMPFFDSDVKPSDEWLMLKMTEGAYVLLNTDPNLYASLFDFSEAWKIDLLEYMNDNYMYDLSMEEMAAYTGRSLSTFKRDFAKVSDLSPQKWIMRRRIEAAHELIRKGKKKISDICFEVGFKNLSHFSRTYKETYGVTPAAHLSCG